MNDAFVRKANEMNYRNRAAFKLLEIDDKFSILRKDSTVLDLGCASGAWSQIATERCKKVVGVDLLRIEPIQGHNFIQGDFNDQKVKDEIRKILGEDKFRVVLSDMAPSTSGVSLDDHLRIMEMNLNTVNICEEFLAPQGWLVMKTFYGPETPKLVSLLADRFTRSVAIKPKSSRKESREIFFVAQKYTGKQGIDKKPADNPTRTPQQ